MKTFHKFVAVVATLTALTVAAAARAENPPAAAPVLRTTSCRDGRPLKNPTYKPCQPRKAPKCPAGYTCNVKPAK